MSIGIWNGDQPGPWIKNKIKNKPHITLHPTLPRINGVRWWKCTRPKDGYVCHDSSHTSPSEALNAYLRSREANK